MRRTLSTLPAVQEAKEVYGKRKPQDSAIAAQTKRQRRVTTSIPYDDHDEGVLVGHLEFMSKEMSKRAPDLQKLSESMKQTRSSRRSWMKDTVPTTAEILEKSPAGAHWGRNARVCIQFYERIPQLVRASYKSFFT
ncbi:hypothetical protein MRX96_044279 [Rhipicephalus microplus]